MKLKQNTVLQYDMLDRFFLFYFVFVFCFDLLSPSFIDLVSPSASLTLHRADAMTI